MNRREFMQCAAMLAAGTAIAPQGWALTEEQNRYLAARAPYIEQPSPGLFNAQQLAAVAAAADITIPRTDTPGAVDAGVPRFIELMVADWFNDDERARFIAGVDGLIAQAGGDFAALERVEQLALLEALEDDASDAEWYGFGATLRVWDSEAPFICQFKELTALGFVLSKTGCREFLRPNPMGKFDGEYPLGPDDPAYDKHTMLRMMAKESN